MRILEALGYSLIEARLYETLVEQGEMNVLRLAEALGVHRPRVYSLLGKLCANHIVLKKKHGKRIVYAAASFTVLQDLMEKRARVMKVQIEKKEKQVAREESLSGIRVLTGVEGLKQVMRDVVEHMGKGGTFYRYSSRRPEIDIRRYMPEEYQTMKAKKQLEEFAIVNHALRKQSVLKKLNRLNIVSRMVPLEKDQFEYDVSLFIYGERLAFINFKLEKAWIIENVDLAQFQMQVFKLLFGYLPS